jgi:hypothetical protein
MASPEQQEAQQNAAAALGNGGMMMGESSPFPDDPHVTDQSSEIADIFGLGEEAGPTPNSSEGVSDGGASTSGATPAAEGGQGQAQPATPATSQPQPGQQGEQSPAPAQPTPAPAAPAADPAQTMQPAPEAVSLQALSAQVQALITQNAQLQEQLRSGSGNQAPQQGPSDQQGQQPIADPYLDYRIAIPDDVAGAIFNEDPAIARQGLTHLINSLGQMIHSRVVKSVTDVHLPQTLQRFQGDLTMTQEQQRMRQEYFNDFPQHNDAGTRLIVAQEAEALWRQNPALSWDANARAALGQRVNARLGVGAQPMQQQPQAATPAPRPAAQMGASPRPAANPADNEGDFISSILSAG